jgi:hypothetical protein
MNKINIRYALFCILLFSSASYVYFSHSTMHLDITRVLFIHQLMFCSVYLVFIVPTGILWLPSLRFFRAFSSVVRQMPGYNLQRRGTARIVLFYVLFVNNYL